MASVLAQFIERRGASRVPVGNMVVSIDPRDGREPILCCVWDLSLEGACLMIPPDVIVPETFAVRVDGKLHQAHVVWRKWPHMGIKFSEEV
jgi:hypothetical protein